MGNFGPQSTVISPLFSVFRHPLLSDDRVLNLGSLREVQGVLALEGLITTEAHKTADHLGASIYKLWKRT